MFKRRHFFRWRRFYLLAGVLLLFGSAFTLWNLSASSVIVSRIVGYVRAVNLAKILDYTFLPLNAYFNHLVNPPEIINNRELLNQELRSLKQELFYKEREIVALKRIESENNILETYLDMRQMLNTR